MVAIELLGRLILVSPLVRLQVKICVPEVTLNETSISSLTVNNESIRYTVSSILNLKTDVRGMFKWYLNVIWLLKKICLAMLKYESPLSKKKGFFLNKIKESW